jgi:hypothetical protein
MVLVGAVAVDVERAVERAVDVERVVMAGEKAEPILQQEGDLTIRDEPQHHVLRILGSFQP